MCRGLMVIGLSTLFVLVLGLVGPGCGEGSTAMAQESSSDGKSEGGGSADEWAKNNPPGRTVAQEHPVVKDNAHPTVPPGEREALGLPAPTWVAAHGKVLPAVREALEAQKKLMGDPMAEFQGDRPCGFQGTAYVDVYLRHEAKGKHASKENRTAIKQVQDRLLSRLTAAEFSLIFAFKNTAGLVGYIDEAGLTKLLADADVVAVGLDDQPRPQDPPPARHEPARRGQKRWTLAEAKIDPQARAALEKSADAFLYVNVVLTGVPWRQGTLQQALKQQRAAEREIEDRVLSTVSAGELKLRSRGGGFSGYVNAAGLAKLDRHADVVGVGLPAPLIQVPKIPKRR